MATSVASMGPPALLRYRRALIVAVHLALIAAGYFAAFALRFDFAVPPRYLRELWATLPHLLLLHMAVFSFFGLYRGYWQHVGFRDLINLIKAVTLTTALFAVVLVATGRLPGVPRSVLAINWLLALVLTGGARFAARFAREGELPLRPARGKRALMIGAGAAAEPLLRTSLRDGQRMVRFIGLVDDDRDTAGMSLHGVPVLGRTEDLVRLVARHRIELLVIAIAAATGEQMRRIVRRCAQTGVDYKIIPSLQELLDGRVRLGQLRDVAVEDLLGREAITLDLEQIERDFEGKVVLVTGGAGSIGAELARQIARFRPARLILFEQAESPLYFVHLEVSTAHPGVEVLPVIGDITDTERVEQVFTLYRPDYVFHAAAYKHVPMMEANVVEAIRNNVFGTLRVAECAERHGVRKFVLISSDKAVNPSSMMGATKRIAERIVLGWPPLRESATDFRAVRFGNVLGSDGSVVPLFKRQLAAGGPVTVTHPGVTRYFMTIPEAVQLVLAAAALREAAGRICMLDMGEPIRILDLAEQMIRLSGLVPHRDVEVVFTGLRPGEKLHEELVSSVEATLPTAVEKIRIVQTDEADGEAVEAGLRRLATALAVGCREGIIGAVRALVPEYTPHHAPAEADSEVRVPAAVEPRGVDARRAFLSELSTGAAARLRPVPDAAPV